MKKPDRRRQGVSRRNCEWRIAREIYAILGSGGSRLRWTSVFPDRFGAIFAEESVDIVDDLIWCCVGAAPFQLEPPDRFRDRVRLVRRHVDRAAVRGDDLDQAVEIFLVASVMDLTRAAVSFGAIAKRSALR
jgi:hypothetical protein